MAEILFNKGVDFWYAHYYSNVSIRFPNEDCIQGFGNFFSENLNKKENKEKLSLAIGQVVNKNYNCFDNAELQDPHLSCFVDEPIEYVKQFQYIRFPDFTNRHLKRFVLRLDINPCIENKGTMTKIYVMPRYSGAVYKKELLDFFHRAQIVCEPIVRILSSTYLRLFNQFVERFNPPDVKKLDFAQLENPYVLISRVAGSDEDGIKTFVELLDSPDEWYKFCRENPQGKSIIDVLAEMNNPIGKHWQLSQYKWFKEKALYEGSAGKEYQQCTGYLGFKGDNELGHFIGIANSFPRDLLLPVHLGIINSPKQ